MYAISRTCSLRLYTAARVSREEDVVVIIRVGFRRDFYILYAKYKTTRWCDHLLNRFWSKSRQAGEYFVRKQTVKSVIKESIKIRVDFESN